MCFSVLWRVCCAWHRNIIKKCANVEMQWEMFKWLGHIMYNTWSGDVEAHRVVDAMEEFREDFVDHCAFLEYFKARWLPKIEMLVTAMRTLPLASQETCGAIETYHFRLKSNLLNESDTGAYQRADWLVHKLTTEVHSHYWFDKYSEENDLCGYMRDEDIAPASWHRALYIVDADVIINEKDLQFAKIVSQSDRTRIYVVWNPGSEFALCECSWSMLGNLCKHVIKVSTVCRNRQMVRPSMALQTYHQALFSLLQCPPHGSIVLDRAITLAIHMQQDLKRLVEP
eukprot:Gb_27435 [translate_table: standard]